jgi:monoamine oxidase
VLVLEARERTGGRVFTDTSLGIAFDHGAPTRAEPTGISLMIGGKEISHEDYQRFAKLSDEIGRTLQVLRKEAPALDPRLVIRTEDALAKLALAEQLRRVSFPPFARLPVTERQLPVRLAARVIRLDSTGPLVRLVTPGGEVTAGAVIVTVPTGVLAAGGLSFAPPLRAERQAAIGALADGAGRQGLRDLLAPRDRRARRHARARLDRAPDRDRGVAAAGRARGCDPHLSRRGRTSARGGRRVGRGIGRGLGAGRAVRQGGAHRLPARRVDALGSRSRSHAAPGPRARRWRGSCCPRRITSESCSPGEATDPTGGLAGANASGQRAAKEALAVLAKR